MLFYRKKNSPTRGPPSPKAIDGWSIFLFLHPTIVLLDIVDVCHAYLTCRSRRAHMRSVPTGPQAIRDRALDMFVSRTAHTHAARLLVARKGQVVNSSSIARSSNLSSGVTAYLYQSNLPMDRAPNPIPPHV